MDAPEVKERHYDPPAGLVRRTTGDVPEEATAARAYAHPILEALAPSRPARPRLVPTADGPIRRLLLTVPSYAAGAAPLAAVYRDLLLQLPAGAGLVVLAQESAEPAVRAWLEQAHRVNAEVVTAPEHLNFSVWAEDGYATVVDEDGGGTFLVEPFSFPRYGDSLVADLVATATDLASTQAPLYFQGGNILVGDDFFLVGADYPANTLRYIGPVISPAPGETPERLVRRLYGEYLDPGRDLHYVASTIPVPAERQRTFRLGGQEWTEVLHLGNAPGTTQPLFHIDMFITLAGRGEDGRYRVLVGDPRQAAAALGQPLQPHAMAEVFDNVAAGLARRGFDVRRNPLPLVYVDDPGARLRLWYFATANNALVHIDGDERLVYLPTYGHGAWPELAETDRRNADLWAGLGFQPRLLPDFHPFAENLGAVHCIKKYLAR